jgi:1-deoxy-D-xylulose-5-phosphate reductoisomerase
MKKKIVILGSTGSIGKTTLSILRKDKKKFNVVLLSTNVNVDLAILQAKEFNVKNIIISNFQKYVEAKIKYKSLNINFHHSFNIIDILFKKKRIYYSMISIVGLIGLNPTLKLIKFSENIGIANKESLICGWNILKSKINKYNTNFIPIDSEHFSLFELLGKKFNQSLVDKIYITASGGPFINLPLNSFSKISVKQTLRHPNWKMGKKITTDSASLMNKVFEVIEARNIFNIEYSKINILIHEKSYVHAILKLKNGITKILIHDTKMDIPIHNSIYFKNPKEISSKPINFKFLNNLNFKKVNKKKFPLIKILKDLPNYNSLYETILVLANDFFVNKFLNKDITFMEMNNLILKFVRKKEFNKFKEIKVKNVKQIKETENYINAKLNKMIIKT